ncbi:S13A2 protein, partial [Atractosteus spatula]|nr:S13A2 protein [Atractosteus spatula]
MALYWCTEALPLSVTALLPVVLFPMMGIMTSSNVCVQYLTDSNMLFIGGLLVAIGVEYRNLHKRIALRVLLVVGVKPALLMMGFMGTTAFLSMWISNTATTAMMVPIAQAVLEQLSNSEAEADQLELQNGHANHSFEPDAKTGLPAERKEGTEDGKGGLPSKYCSSQKQRKGLYIGHARRNSWTKSFFYIEAASDRWCFPTDTCPAMTMEAGVDSASEMASRRVEKYANLYKGMSLSVCYAASIGGTATLTGTTPNLILKGQIDKIYPQNGDVINFASWFGFAFPNMVLMLSLSWVWLQFIYLGFNLKQTFGCGGKTAADKQAYKVIKDEYKKLGRMNFSEVAILILFVTLVLLWFTREPGFIPGWATYLFNKNDTQFVTDGTVAIFMSLLLFVIPSELPTFSLSGSTTDGGRIKAPKPLLLWEVVHEKMPWNIVLLLGGGFALAKGSEDSGLSKWLGQSLSPMKEIPAPATAILLSFLVSTFTECSSNTATTTLFLPILASMATAIELNPLYVMLPCTICASLAFMLPVATPPNAIVFSYGNLKVIDMRELPQIPQSCSPFQPSVSLSQLQGCQPCSMATETHNQNFSSSSSRSTPVQMSPRSGRPTYDTQLSPPLQMAQTQDDPSLGEIPLPFQRTESAPYRPKGISTEKYRRHSSDGVMGQGFGSAEPTHFHPYRRQYSAEGYNIHLGAQGDPCSPPRSFRGFPELVSKWPSGFRVCIFFPLQFSTGSVYPVVPQLDNLQYSFQCIAPDCAQEPPHTLYPKPIYSYSILIFMALRNSKTGSLPVSEIYNFMTEHFPYFKTAPDGWKNSVRHNLSLNKCFEKVESKCGSSSRKGCLWALNPAKVEKMQEELHKWRRKDPLTVRKSMARPEELDRLLGDKPDKFKVFSSGLGQPFSLRRPADFERPPSFTPSQHGALSQTARRSFQGSRAASLLAGQQPPYLPPAPQAFSYLCPGGQQVSSDTPPRPDSHGSLLPSQTPPAYSAALQAEHCTRRSLQESLADGELSNDVDMLNPSLTDFQLQGSLWEDLKDDSLALDSLVVIATSPSSSPPGPGQSGSCPGQGGSGASEQSVPAMAEEGSLADVHITGIYSAAFADFDSTGSSYLPAPENTPIPLL